MSGEGVMTRWLRAAAGVLMVAAFLVPAAMAAPTDEDCMACHAEDVGRAPVDLAVLHGSVHGSFSCTRCHVAATSIPHAEHMPEVRCSSCHVAARRELRGAAHGDGDDEAVVNERCVGCHGGHGIRAAVRFEASRCASCHGEIVRKYQGSVHGVALASGKDPDASSCDGCHGRAHLIRKHDDPDSPTNRANVAATCARCHADRELMIKRKIAIPLAVQLYRRSVHGRSKNPKAATCTDCHESHHLLSATDPASSINKRNIPTTCGRCHPKEAKAYEESVHGTALARGVTASPTCTDCHGEHLIRGPNDPESPVSVSSVTKTCSHCHEAEGIRETYGLPSGRLSTYEDSYHGLAARGGSPVAANCASCHGYHEILPSSDPRSRIYPANLPKTCGSCHPGAGPEFAKGKVHVAAVATNEPVLAWVRWIYLTLIVGTIAGMFFHNALDFSKKMRRSLGIHLGQIAANGARISARWFVRMTLSERIQHATLAVSFFVLVYTGFALKFPEAWPFAWLARLETGYHWRSIVHRVAAVVMILAALFHLVYLATRRGRGFLVAMLPRLKDARDAGENMAYLTGHRDQPPAFDRFGYIEKAEYWALIWGTVVMSLTGFALWFENESLQWMPKWWLDVATLIHYYEAWLAFLAIVVWHLYYVIVNPDTYPMNWTWLTGRISETHLRHEHRLQWERLMAAELSAEEAAEAAGAGAAPAGGGAPARASDVLLEGPDAGREQGNQREDHDQRDPHTDPPGSPVA